MAGITAYSVYIPVNGRSADEDSFTMVVAAIDKLNDLPDVEAVYFGSESHPYKIKSTAAMVADWFNWGPKVMAADLEFACKSGTTALQMMMGMVDSDMVANGLIVGADVAQARAGDALAKTVGSGAAAFFIGKENVIADLVATVSFCTDTADFWRHQDEEAPRHAGRFTGEPGYFRHTIGAFEELQKKTGFKTEEIDYFVFHQPNATFSGRVAHKLGIDLAKIEAASVFDKMGNAYSATVLVALAQVLDVAQAGAKIVMVSYGSGAGADAFLIECK